MNFTSFSAVIPQPVAQTTPAKSGGGGVDVSKYYETERFAKFQEFAKVISDLIEFNPSKEDIQKEGESLRNRLMDARQDKLIATISGSGGNATATVYATKAAEQEALLSYMYDMLKDSPKQYLAFKKAEMISKVAPGSQGLAALIASGGLNKAEALQAAANMLAASAQMRGVGMSMQSGSTGGGDPTPMDYFLDYVNKGGPKNAAYKALEKNAVNFAKTIGK
ncbi:MAG TPA: hypothetical protein PL124_03915 [Candidatus Cloacimonadota bacterium]|nr:hypothetical protein [Candidatus Cloacimonadota bacterium]